MPGMLPVLNKYVVEQAVRTGLGLKAKINLTSVFERKNYFYADLPQGYQISQYLHPIVGEGIIVIDLEDGETRAVGRSEEHTSELQSLMRNSYDVLCLKKKKVKTRIQIYKNKTKTKVLNLNKHIIHVRHNITYK